MFIEILDIMSYIGPEFSRPLREGYLLLKAEYVNIKIEDSSTAEVILISGACVSMSNVAGDWLKINCELQKKNVSR